MKKRLSLLVYFLGLSSFSIGQYSVKTNLLASLHLFKNNMPFIIAGCYISIDNKLNAKYMLRSGIHFNSSRNGLFMSYGDPRLRTLCMLTKKMFEKKITRLYLMKMKENDCLEAVDCLWDIQLKWENVYWNKAWV